MSERRGRGPLLRLDREAKILRFRDHAMTGARLTLVRAEKSSSRKWTVCWLAPWQKTLPRTCKWTTLRAAESNFVRMAQEPPLTVPHLTRDWQQTRFYKWEQANILKGSATLTHEQMENVVARVSRDFNMAAPTLHFSRARPKSLTLGYYQQDRHHIEMHDKHLHYLLHELSHAVDYKINRNRLASHGPSFVRTAMILSARYAFQSTAGMENSAKAMSLHVAPESTVPAARRIAVPA